MHATKTTLARLPKASRTLQSYPIQLDRHQPRWLTTIEQLSLRKLIDAPPDISRQRLSSRPPFGIKFPKLRHRLLHDFATASDRAHQPPVNMALAIFASPSVTQVHAHTLSRRADI
jgi:hypothetical protein